MVKTPNVVGICQGVDVQASLTTSGSGGFGCSDIFEYRTNNGFGFSVWTPYIPSSLISTTGLTQVEIRSYRGDCINATCNQTTPVVFSWTITAPPIAPVLTPIPNNPTICQGTLVSATAVAGSGGLGCADVFEYRTHNGTIWSAWLTYVPSNTINTIGIQHVEIKGYRSCDISSGCVSADTSFVQWDVYSNIVSPVMAKVPNVDTVCQGNNVNAILLSSGAGGSGCTDIFQFATNGSSTWLTYTPGTAISTVGLTSVRIRYYRGGCADAAICDSVLTTLTWIIVPPIVGPTLSKTPDVTSLCEGTALFATVTPGSGGSLCSDIIQYRTNNGTLWSSWQSYISGTNINSAGLTNVEIRAFRGNCGGSALCTASDTASALWNIFPQPIAPVLVKNPNVTSVCDGAVLSATLTSPGSGGAGCIDVIQYRSDNGGGFSAWQNYTPSTAIPTTGLVAVQIISYRGNCDINSLCIQTVVDTIKWNITLQPTDPSIVRTPNLDTICSSSVISATTTVGIGGVGCTNYNQYRMKIGIVWTGWMNYTSGNIIPHGANVTEVQVRAFRGNCTLNSGCITSDTAFAHWVFSPQLVRPVLQKNPNTAQVCDGGVVSASLITAGSGGFGCSDVINFRTNNGSGYSAWAPYTLGTSIPTIGLTHVQIVSYRGNCNILANCTQTTADTILWTVIPQPTDPVISRVPNEDTVCRQTLLSAIITNGINGSSCTNYSQYRTNNGTSWSSWTNYLSGALVPYTNSDIRVEVRAFRGDCLVGSGCVSSDTVTVFWNIASQPIAPILVKNPNIAGVCAGISVSATVVTPGSGGVGCSDNYEYRTNNSFVWSAWMPYTPLTLIPTTGLAQVEIRSWRGACPTVGCNSTDTTLLQWTINSTTTEPTIIRTPDQDLVCQGTLVSATITPGVGGVGCADVSEYRTLTTGTWSAWNNYVSANTLNTIAIDSVEIRTYKICPPITGCPSTDTNIVAWKVAGTLLMPVLAKIPNTDSICESTMIGASLVTAGSGGSGCVDIYEISTNGGTTWSAYLPGTMINSVGLTDVRIHFYRAGCADATLCGATPTEFVWTIVPQAIEPTIVKNPNIAGVCEGTPVSGIITPGSGGVQCSDTYESRTYDGITWSAWTSYTSGSIINTAALQTIEVRVFRGNCSLLSGCFSTDTNTVSWNIYPQPTAPVLANNPATPIVCDGTALSATLLTAGSGGSGCSDVIEYRTDNGSGYSAWQNYIPSTAISSTGLVAVQIISYRGNCDPSSLCVQTPVDTITWNIVPQPADPTIVKSPNIDTLCSSSTVFATITPGIGGVDCSSFSQYRMMVGTIWTGWMNYTSDNIIPHGANISEIQVRAFRGDCNPISGCFTSDTATISWVLVTDPVGTILQKNPDVTSVCEGVDVNASLITAGIGGFECSDIINYRIDNGSGYSVWMPYTPSTLISTTGLTQVQIVSSRGNCNPFANCGESPADSILWTVIPQPTAPIIVRTPATDTVCFSTVLSASITDGTNGTACTNYHQYRLWDGTTWTAWNPYVNNSLIPYVLANTQIQVRAFRGNCDPLAGCLSSDTTMVQWWISPQPVNPVLSKMPDVITVCDGTNVWAVLNTPGSGGVGCSDEFQYRTNNGSGYSTWSPYVLTTNINTTGLTAVQIISARGNCSPSSLCTTIVPDTITWMVIPQLTDPVIARNPNPANDSVCSLTALSATVTSGNGGVGCTNYSQYSMFDGTTWTPWVAYTSDANIVYPNNVVSVVVRAWRGDCSTATGCLASDTISTHWDIVPQPQNPLITKVPDFDSICTGSVRADLVSAGTGGAGCSDVFEIRVDNGAGYGAWAAYVPGTNVSTIGVSAIQIHAYRGNCTGIGCISTTDTVLTWVTTTPPIQPTIVRTPDQNIVCQGTMVSGAITSGSGGSPCGDVYEYRSNDGITWSAWQSYISNSPIATIGITDVQIRVYRLCNPFGGCPSTDTTTIAWSVSSAVTMPVMNKIPNFDGVCSGTDVSASLISSGSGGSIACTDVFEYRTYGAGVWSSWLAYTPSVAIPTVAIDSVQIQYYRGGCPEAAICNIAGPATFTWFVAPQPIAPQIVRVPDVNQVCSGANVSGIITSGAGGAGCSDSYEYRTYNGTAWSAWQSYTSAQIISTIGNEQVEARVFRDNCFSTGGCISPDTTTIHWDVMPPIVSPILARVPNVNNLCQNNFVQADLIAAGSGGAGCSDVFAYRTNNGVWSAFIPYIPGTAINSTGITSIQVISYRGNCLANALCVEPTADTLTWNFVAPPTPPTILRNPDNNICNGTAISAIVTPGTNGIGCSDTYQYRTFDSGAWSIWLSYTSGNNIPYSATATQTEVRAFRANCDPTSGCNFSDTTTGSWVISVPIVAPVMVKVPDIAGVCDGTPVSATLVSAGSSGLNCTDTYEFRTNDGSGFGAWSPYLSTTLIPTTGLTEVEIRFARNICDPLNVCVPPAPVVFNWAVNPQPTAPLVVKTPTADSVCVGVDLSGIITPGTGGSGCTDLYEYRIQDTLGLWSAWMLYSSNSIIHSDTIHGAQIRVSRTGCFTGIGCADPIPVTVEWVVFPQPTIPTLVRIPDQDAVCESTLLTANLIGTANGGAPPTMIEYQYENPASWTWNPGNSFVPNTNGMAYIRARATSNGPGCINSDWQWVSWIVDPKPVITTPANQTICEGGSVQLDAQVAGGIGTVAFAWEMSNVSCAGPWTVIADSTRSSIVTSALFDTTWYRLTATQVATSCFDVTSCIAVNVKPAPIVTINGQTSVCSGGTVLTANVVNLPNPATYQWQNSISATGPWVNTGTNSNTFTIPLVTGSTYYRCNIIGDTIGCSATSAATLVQLSTSPIISSQSLDTSICIGHNVVLNVNAQSVPTPTYQWYGPSGLIIGAISDTLNINNALQVDSGAYYCEVMSFCDTVSTPIINVHVLGNIIAATTISGTTERCQGSGFDGYTTDAQNVLSNQWTILPSEAGTINPSTGFVTWNSSFVGIAQINVHLIGCDTSFFNSLNVIVDTAVQLPIISGSSSRCQGSGTDQYIATTPGSISFVWSISNAGSSSINPTTGFVVWDSTFAGTSTIYAYANGCGGPSENAAFTVYTVDSITFTQSGSQNWCANDSNALWVSPFPNAGNSFQWFDANGAINGATDSALVFNPIQISHQGAYYCRIITVCGDTLYSLTDSVNVHPLPQVDFLISGVCRLDSVHFVNLSTILNGTISYQWSFGDGSLSTNLNPTHIYLTADTFNVVLTATSEWGCSQSFNQQLIIHDLPQAIVTTVSDSCNGGGHGSIMVSPTFGTPPFLYLISGGFTQVDSVFSPLYAGSYIITVTDSNGCKNNIPVVVTQPNSLSTFIYPHNVLCYNDSSGIADLVITGGTSPYQFLWSNGFTTEDLSNVPAGNYSVNVIDALGCLAYDSTTLLQPNPLIVDSLVVQPSCLQLNDGKIFLFVSGGTGNYNYLWSTGGMLDSLVNLSPNLYQVTVSDANGCKSISDYQIFNNNNDCLTIWTSFSPDGDGVNDVWNIGHIELYPENTVQIFNRWGALLFESKGYTQPWDGTWQNKELPAETYYYVINLGDGSDILTGTVTIIR
ncbi:MAG: gliding motility-associated C-terminal domain-containing protein [Bacteroidota bacterium]